jgi:hypothetical protein
VITCSVDRRSQFWSQLFPFVGGWERPTDRFASVNEDVRIGLDLGLRIWKAGWVNSPRGFESRILRRRDSGNAVELAEPWSAVQRCWSTELCQKSILAMEDACASCESGRGGARFECAVTVPSKQPMLTALPQACEISWGSSPPTINS